MSIFSLFINNDEHIMKFSNVFIIQYYSNILSANNSWFIGHLNCKL